MSTANYLPGPAEHAWEWQLHGACRGTDAELFFHPWGERDPSRSRRDAAAVAVCHRCRVMQECRAYAVETREPYGVWGGLTEERRTARVSRVCSA